MSTPPAVRPATPAAPGAERSRARDGRAGAGDAERSQGDRRGGPSPDDARSDDARSDDAPEPRWPALLAAIAVALLYLALPGALTLGPPWMLPAAVVALLVPTVASHRMRRSTWNQAFGTVLLAVMTTALVAGLVRLLLALPTKLEAPATLLRSAAALWAANVLVFASWYWRVDAGGPHARARSHPRAAEWEGAFLFPQQTMDADDGGGAQAARWRPQFVDYLFLAFNTSTAFSPTDAPVLSRWAKLLMMLQSLISFCTVAVLAARAVGIL